MRRDTTARNVGTMSRFLAFLVRLHKSREAQNSGVALDSKIPTNCPDDLLEAISSLLKAKESVSNSTLSDEIHQIVCRVLSLPRDQNPFMDFLVFRNVKPSGMICLPSDIAHRISEIKWPFRATTFHEIASRWHTEEGADGDTSALSARR